MRKFLPFLIMIALMAPMLLAAQTGKEEPSIRQERLSRIDFYHVSVGASFYMNRNVGIAPQLSAGIGSFRNILNGDVGIRYLFLGQFPRKGVERVSVQQLPVFVSLNVNPIKWASGCVYVGGGIAFTPTIAAFHCTADGNHISDLRIGKNHFTPFAKLGFRVNHIDGHFFYEYDLKPSFNQKYIYESEEFDYVSLKHQLFERMRFGFTLLYHFDF